jgi:hypothetical protein
VRGSLAEEEPELSQRLAEGVSGGRRHFGKKILPSQIKQLLINPTLSLESGMDSSIASQKLLNLNVELAIASRRDGLHKPMSRGLRTSELEQRVTRRSINQHLPLLLNTSISLFLFLTTFLLWQEARLQILAFCIQTDPPSAMMNRIVSRLIQNQAAAFRQASARFGRQTLRNRRYQSTESDASSTVKQSFFQRSWNSPIGLKTVHFWYASVSPPSFNSWAVR